MLKTLPRARFKKGGGGLGGFLRGFFAARGYCPRKRPPGPPTPPPPPMKNIVSGTSEQLGMRPRCNPTIRTAPTNVYGRVSSAWVFPAVGTRNLGTVGLRGGHGVAALPWQTSATNVTFMPPWGMGGPLVQECVPMGHTSWGIDGRDDVHCLCALDCHGRA